MTNDDPATRPRIERATAADAARLAPVIEAAFPRWPAMRIRVPALEHARWKMEGPSGGPPHTHTTVVEGDAVVAAQLRWLAWAHVGPEIIPFDRGADLAVHPDYQGRGLARFIFEDDADRNPPLAPFIRWDTPSNNEKVLHLDIGDQVTWPLRVWTRAFTLRTFVGLHRAAGAGHLGRAALRALTRGRSPRGAPTYRVEELSRFDEETDELWNRTRGAFDIARVRNAALMNWRYLDPRGGAATVIAAYGSNGLLVAYLVFKQAGRTGQIVDVVSDPAHALGVIALVRLAAARLRELGCSHVICWLPPDHPAERALEAARFVDTAQERPVLFETTWMPPAPEAIAIVENPASRLHVMLGDFDFV